ncbi:ATP-binding protein [Labrys monachus]|uniref:histidine kinase n=1 Tax=Labrys monachus TaxID=217067 RepID=A0ABU0FAJ4_9HYPH|nr:ATP-binding protein [Labrys monachus]MDQ0391648.1 signal transduction histidine kinase [Labrys monachus]
MQDALTSKLRAPLPDLTIRSCDMPNAHDEGDIQVLARLNGQTVEFVTRGREPPAFAKLTFPLVGALLFLCVAVAAMSAWAVWRVIGPLRRLSEKADAFGHDIAVAPIDEEGPVEIRRVARAYNLMQERIARSVQDRTRMLAAISHDLRTPLTRMRLLLETSPPGDMEAKLLRNVILMQSMVTSALAYLSGRVDQEEPEWLDLGALLHTLRDEFEEAGFHVHYDGPERLECFCRPNAMARALTNLLENACHFGREITIRADTTVGGIIVDVEDDGPGIPDDRRRDVVEPFVRLDPSRANRPGSVGLGLSIVQEILSGHDGTLALLDRQPHGLVARITLPNRGSAPARPHEIQRGVPPVS